MSDKDFWRDRFTFYRKDQTGMDPVSRLPRFEPVKILENEPCDFELKTRRIGVQTPAGTVYQTVEEPRVKIWPDDPTKIPDEDDECFVNDRRYKVANISHFEDGATGDYRGALLVLTQPSVPHDRKPVG